MNQRIYLTCPNTGDVTEYACDTLAEIEEASRALAEAGVASAKVWAGDDADGVETGQILFAADTSAD